MTTEKRETTRKSAAKEKIKGTTHNWESGRLGLSEDHAEPISAEEMIELADGLDLELKPISIRLPKTLIKQLKFIAYMHGVGYQPLIRDILSRFSRHEIVDLVMQIEEQKEAEATLSDEDSPAARHLRDCA